MLERLFQQTKRKDLLEKLRNRQVPTEEIGHAIVTLGKPFKRSWIDAAKDVVASYLDHPDSWVRHEAMWFLGSWGKLKEYQPALIHVLRTDTDQGNRSFAATCLGHLQEGTGDQEAVEALIENLEHQGEDELLRLHAYAAILEIVNGRSQPIFWPHDHKLSDVDWDWVRSLHSTTNH